MDVGASEVTPPPAFAETLNDCDVYLLPAGWLDKGRLVEAVRVVHPGITVPNYRWAESGVLLWTDGAPHGVPGLPTDAQRWPTRRLRRSARGYLLVAMDDPRGLGDWQRVYSSRPAPSSGHRLLEVRIGRLLAIDVFTTAAQLQKLDSVRSDAGRLVSEGVEILLPATSYPDVQSVGRGITGAARGAPPLKAQANVLPPSPRDKAEDPRPFLSRLHIGLCDFSGSPRRRRLSLTL